MEDISIVDLQPGNNVGGYTLIARLGGGAMGSVWRVKDDGGNQYAMKILRASMNISGSEDIDGEQARARLRLKREALALQRIHHPGVCSIVDMELDASIAFIVTELIDGHNLREDVAENGPYLADDLERLTHKLIEAVQAVHEAGIIHRDIKPTNVMIAATGPVLVDFGIAMGEGESHVTRTGLVMGTPGFIAPEIIEGSDADELTDWWSLAAVLAFAATGKPVFGTKPLMAVLERAASGNADLSGLPPKTLAAFRDVLQPQREKRCSPNALEQAISEDAMNPLAWPEANRPFDRSAAGETARAMWRETMDEKIDESQGESTDEMQTICCDNVIETSALPLSATTVMPQRNTVTSQPHAVTTQPEHYESNISQDVDSSGGAVSNPPSQYSYLLRGAWALTICAPICSLIAIVNVLDAVAVSALMMWITATVGYNIAAKLRRQQLHNGTTPRHDVVMRVAGLPWHSVCGLAYTIPRIIGIVAGGVVGSVAYPLLCGSSPELLSVTFGSVQVFVPTYHPEIFSQTSVGYVLGFIVAWIVMAIIKGTTVFCSGLGALFCSSRRVED